MGKSDVKVLILTLSVQSFNGSRVFSPVNTCEQNVCVQSLTKFELDIVFLVGFLRILSLATESFQKYINF